MADALPAEMSVLMDLVSGFEKAAVVLGAVQLDVFSPLSKGPGDIPSLVLSYDGCNRHRYSSHPAATA